ncbi:hypothetical protein PSEUDO8AS_30150 [Pseudomonas sp. 8AS]|uniref:DUF6694 family lipoprotein n=1 Tax=Pseudomonas sp. 8AS TaxID=2653163 RepID=UPI0012EEEE64|nr:DUF6694 family lipoprotein [Pseudomonas sp. 8AS]VXB76555.1 hypothetical protein PSEUDO8AS_30150 [Pseudomonas sp. 8AS]
MKHILRTWVVLTLAGLISACGGPELNGKSQETLLTSMQEIIESLDTKEAHQFQKDYVYISTSMLNDVKFDLNAINTKQNEILEAFDGKTAEDVAEMANEMREAKKLADEKRGPVINGESMSTFDRSIRELARTLNKEERAQLHTNIEIIINNIQNKYKGQLAGKELTKTNFLLAVDGKSFSEVAEMADAIRTN